MGKILNTSSKMIMVTGAARSGTTLLAECLNHHPRIMCIADPMNEFFKGFYYFAYSKVENEKKDVEYPVDHFFFSGSLRVKTFIDQTDLRHKIPANLRKRILGRIIERDGQFCPEIVEPLNRCKADTFEALYLEIMGILYEIFGTTETEWFGVKTVWCEQMILPLSRTFPNMSFIQIIRDPRAVISSNYLELTNRYPLLINIRDWRKSLYYAWKFSRLGPIGERFIALRYEDLVDDPSGVLSELMEKMGIDFDRSMLETQFKKPNTSYGEAAANRDGISGTFKAKWKKTLPKDLVVKIERFTDLEMQELHYRRLYDEDEIDLDDFASLEDIPYNSLSDWCKDIVQSEDYYKNAWLVENMLLEKTRHRLIHDEEEASDEKLLEQYFYEKDYYLDLRNNRIWGNRKNFIKGQKV